jgi:phosphatidylglycerol:prolipoprotein diacylglycerol transferase
LIMMLPLLDPIAIAIGGVKIHWYGIILGTAALVGLLLIIREGKRYGISSDFFMDLVLIGVPSAIIGARIYYVAFQWEDYQHNFSEVFKIWHGGIAIHGALIGAVIGAAIYTRMKKVNFWRIADITAPGLIVGQMIGRWGNFMNQEAHGGVVERSFLSDTLHLPSWIVNNMEIMKDGVLSYYHPTFLYESIWNLLGLVFLLWLRRRPFLRSGELFLSYFIWYSIGRFYIEGLRTDSLAFHGPDWLASLVNGLWAPMKLIFKAGELPEGGGNVRIAQLIGIFIIIAAVVLMYLRRRQGHAEERYSDPILFGVGNDSGPGTTKNSSPPPTIVDQEINSAPPAPELPNIQQDEQPSANNKQEEPYPIQQERVRPGKPFI